jgi:hypothetical protein
MSTADDSFDYMDNVPDLTVTQPVYSDEGPSPEYDPYATSGRTYGPSTVGYTGEGGTYVANSDGTLDFIPNDSGVITYTDPVTGVVTQSGGNAIGGSSNTSGSTVGGSPVGGSDVLKKLLDKATTPGGLGFLASLLGSALGSNKAGASPGWKGVIDPNAYVANRAQIEQPEYQPYSGKPVMGGRQFTDVSYSKPGEAAPKTVNGVPLADLLAKNGIESLTKDFGPKEDNQAGPLQPGGSFTPKTDMPTEWQSNLGPDDRPMTMDIKPGDILGFNGTTPILAQDRTDNIPQETMYANLGGMAAGGVAGLARGGRYLHGKTDGMADKLNTTIDEKQAAKLSHGEFVIPADVVSHLGNGNSTAGADVLYRMMDRVRKARTGNPKQGKQINPEKFMPGGLASLPAYADGGAVAFNAGDVVKAPGTSSTGMPATNESNLSSWAGPGIADYITRGTALAKEPYQAYKGPLTAGTSPLQNKAFTAAGNLSVPTSIGAAGTAATDIGNKMGAMSYSPVGSTFDAAAATKYMNPYLQASLDPQMAEARRQSQITQMANDAKATQAGAFGGSRSALMNTETQRNLGTNLAGIAGAGYNTAYDKATAQFNAEEARKAQEAQFGSTFGMNALTNQLGANTAAANIGSLQNAAGIANLNALSGAGATERGIEAEGIAAKKAAFEEERGAPMAGILATQNLYKGLPVSTVTSSTATSPAMDVSKAFGNAQDLATAIDELIYGKKPK